MNHRRTTKIPRGGETTNQGPATYLTYRENQGGVRGDRRMGSRRGIDPVTYAVVSAALAVGLLATSLPARRASIPSSPCVQTSDREFPVVRELNRPNPISLH